MPAKYPCATRPLRPASFAVLAIAAALLSACGGSDEGVTAATEKSVAFLGSGAASTLPVEEKSAATRNVERFIVVFHPTVTDPAAEAARIAGPHGTSADFVYTTALKGFAVTLPSAAADAFLQAIERNPNVDYVETVQEVTASQVVQPNATWGLDRTDQIDLPLSTTYSYASTGANVHAYVVDTGILLTHQEFAGRTELGATAINDGRGSSDCNGHGTHVAGTIGGTTWGMAKGVTLVPVRVLNCRGSGTTSGVIAGIDWVAQYGVKPAVLNMSLGGGASSALDTAVANAVAQGITVVVAAGNSNADACNYSPARAPSAITVGATTSSDARASYSNYGACLDLFAPGSAIKSAWYTSTSATNTISGTSMASPHVAGAAVLLLSSNPSAAPAEVGAAITAAATTGKVASAGTGSANRLLYVGSQDVEPPAQPVTTAVSVSDLTGTAAAGRKSWSATVTIEVRNGSSVPVSGARVAGAFTVGGSSVACTTSGDGLCSITSGNISKRTSQTKFTVTGISGSNMAYDAPATAPSIVIDKP